MAELGSSPYINHFIQPDTIIPNPADPQSWNRYSYVGNNPIRYSDPSGHKACGSVDSYGGCDDKEEKVFKLVDYVEQHLMNKNKTGIKGKHTSLGAMLKVVNKAAHIFGKDWDGFLDATTYVFTGYAGHGYEAMARAGYNSKFDGYFDDDTGFHDDFMDDSNQVRHFWAAFGTAADPYGDNPMGGASAAFGNWWHDVATDGFGNDGATIIDYKLSITGIDLATQVGNEIKTPFSLAKVLLDHLGTDGFGYTSDAYINPHWWITPND
jgi:hypothetical protein